MAGELAKLFVEIDADTKKFNTGIDGAKKETTKFQGGLDNLAGTVKKLIGAGVLIALANKIKDVGVASINAASDAQETQNKFNVVFSGISDYANDMAESLAISYGTSIDGAKDMLAGTGDLLTGLGFTQESAFDLSEQVLTLGADLASFTNYSGGAEGASQALTKALLGERESLKGLGISINESDVKAELLRQTQQGLTFDTKQQAKAQATLTLALSQTENAQGDFARSSDSYANQLKIAKARTSDVQVELGRALLPTATKGIGIFSTLTGKLGAYIKSLNDVKKAEDAQANGIATKEQELIILQDKLSYTEKEIKFQKNLIASDIQRDGIVTPSNQRELNALQSKQTALGRAIGLKQTEIKAEGDLAEANRKTKQAVEDKAEAERQASEARVIQHGVDIDNIDKVIEANKDEITVIDEQIQQLKNITGLTEEENAKRLESIRLLQADKKVIIDEETLTKEEALLAELTAQQAFDEETRAILKKAREDRALSEEEAKQKRITDIQDEISLYGGYATSILGIISNIQTTQLNAIEASKNAQIDRLDRDLLGEEGYAEAVDKINKETAEKKYEIELAQFRTNKVSAIIESGIATALAVTKSFPNLILAGIVGGLGATQIAAIASQPDPPKPQLATGAIITGSQRGVDVTVAEGGQGEIIQGMGSKGRALRNQLANETADVLLSRGAIGGTTINLYGKSMLTKRDLDEFAIKLRPSIVKANQRVGA